MIGEKDREVYKGAKIAIALLSEPEHSTVLRKMWRVKTVKAGPGIGNNAKPDFQELLSGIELLIWVQKGLEESEISLKEKLEEAMNDPKSISRFGSLCLGESTHLVNDVSWAKEKLNSKFQLLRPVAQGQLSLPIWVDHVGSFKTKWMQFDLEEDCTKEKISHEIFVTIAP
jgi:CRISPR-associated protein Cas5t